MEPCQSSQTESPNLTADISRINLCSVSLAAPGLSVATLLCLVFSVTCSIPAPPPPPPPPSTAGAAINPSEAHSSDLTSDIFGVANGALQAAKWWRPLGAHHLLPSFLAAVRHRRSRPLLRELMLTTPPPPTLCPPNGPLRYSVTHGFTWKHWTAITCLFRVNGFCLFLFMDLLLLLQDAGMNPGNLFYLIPKSLKKFKHIPQQPL